MRRGWLWVALGLAVAMTGVHVVVGGRMIAGPLLASGLETLPRMTLYLCWHGVTIVLAGMGALFADGLVRGRREGVMLAGGAGGGVLRAGVGVYLRLRAVADGFAAMDRVRADGGGGGLGN